MSDMTNLGKLHERLKAELVKATELADQGHGDMAIAQIRRYLEGMADAYCYLIKADKEVILSWAQQENEKAGEGATTYRIGSQPDLFTRIRYLEDRNAISKRIADAMHQLRMLGNQSAHLDIHSKGTERSTLGIQAALRQATFLLRVLENSISPRTAARSTPPAAARATPAAPVVYSEVPRTARPSPLFRLFRLVGRVVLVAAVLLVLKAALFPRVPWTELSWEGIQTKAQSLVQDVVGQVLNPIRREDPSYRSAATDVDGLNILAESSRGSLAVTFRNGGEHPVQVGAPEAAQLAVLGSVSGPLLQRFEPFQLEADGSSTLRLSLKEQGEWPVSMELPRLAAIQADGSAQPMEGSGQTLYFAAAAAEDEAADAAASGAIMHGTATRNNISFSFKQAVGKEIVLQYENKSNRAFQFGWVQPAVVYLKTSEGEYSYPLSSMLMQKAFPASSGQVTASFDQAQGKPVEVRLTGIVPLDGRGLPVNVNAAGISLTLRVKYE